jgi:hypothetical protein
MLMLSAAPSRLVPKDVTKLAMLQQSLCMLLCMPVCSSWELCSLVLARPTAMRLLFSADVHQVANG